MGRKFEKGKFTRQLQEIDEELTKFDGMEGIDINAKSLPYQDSNTSPSPDSPEINMSQNPIFLANQGSSSQIIESR